MICDTTLTMKGKGKFEMSKYLFTLPTDGAGSWILWITAWIFTLVFAYIFLALLVLSVVLSAMRGPEEKKEKKENVASDNNDLMDAFRSPLKSEYGDMEDDRSGWRL